MLRTSRPRSDACEFFICYRCLSKSRPGPRDNGRRRHLSIRYYDSGEPSRLKSSRPFGAYHNGRSAAIPGVSFAPVESSEPPPPDTKQIRLRVIESLRNWEAENASIFVPPPDTGLDFVPGQIPNPSTRAAADDTVINTGEAESEEQFNAAVFGQEDLLDIGASRLFLRPGDLVELPTGASQTPQLAIFVRYLELKAQFYTIQSGWAHGSSLAAQFRVPHFVEPHELAEVLPYLPTSDMPPEELDKLNMMERRIPSSIGRTLLRKMRDFMDESDAIYRANSAALDNCHAPVSHPRDFKNSTLHQIASVLLPKNIMKKTDPKALSPALYAVHRALNLNDAGFKKPQRYVVGSGGYLEILSKADVRCLERVKGIVREYLSIKLSESSGAPRSERNLLSRFVKKAQQYIDFSRKSRSFTMHGTIITVPTSPGDKIHPSSKQLPGFDESDKMFIQFLELWVALEFIRPSSSLNSTSLTILRAIGRYHSSEQLGHREGWVLLQELGIIYPWESLESFQLRLPNTGLRLSALPTEPTTGFVPDKLKSIRQDWKDLPVYCIDGIGAHEIDDGISIEATDTANEYWLHVHVADPGAHIDPSGAAANYAQALVGSVYMPNRVVNMLLPSYVKANLSLARDRPCLTYSAKINTNGELLDYKISAGIVRKVLHITPRTAYEVVRKSPYPLKNRSLSVGERMPQSESRSMIQPQELSDRHQQDIGLIHLIGMALTKQRELRGGYGEPRPEITAAVSTNGIRQFKKDISTYYLSDPSIRILSAAVDSQDPVIMKDALLGMVAPIMMLAGEVAARWCRDRGIPTMYRVTPRNEDNAGPGEFFAKYIRPKIEEGADFDPLLAQSYRDLVGGVQLSSTPGPHIAAGMELYTRSTSPLRRWSDLVLQWQIEATILEEARLGKSLVGNTREDFLPFSRAHIDVMIPYVDGKEKLTARSKHMINKHWLSLLILRASFYGHGKIPKSFSFVVTKVHVAADLVRGQMDDFAIQVMASCDICPVTEIQIGDIFEIEPDAVDMYRNGTTFKVLRRLDQAEKEALDRENSLMMDREEIV